MTPFCRTCGHATLAHVEGGGPCTWRGAPPFVPCRCDGFAGEPETLEPVLPAIDRERFLADAERAFRICYPERWDELVRAVERGWPTDAPREGDTGFQQISIEATEDEEPGIQQVEIDAASGAEPVRTPADEFLDRVQEAVAVRNWQPAFDNLREAMNVRGSEAAEAWLEKVFCPTCVRRVAQPEPSTSTADYARFWRGRCPSCQGTLILR